jgi:hypothetical protein
MRALVTTLAVSIILSFSALAQTENNINPATGVAYGVDPATGKQWGPSHQWTGPGSAPGLSPYQVQCPDGSWSTAVGYCGGTSEGQAVAQAGQGGRELGTVDADDIARLQGQIRFDPNSPNGAHQVECKVEGPNGKIITYWSTSVGSCGGAGGGATGGQTGEKSTGANSHKNCLTQAQHDEQKRLWDDMIAQRCKPAFDYEKNNCSDKFIRESGNNSAVIKSCADSRAFWSDLCFGNRPLAQFKPQFPICSGDTPDLKTNQKYLACQKQHEYLSKNCKSVADWSSSDMNCKSIYNDAFKKDCSEFPTLAFTPPVDDSSTKNKLYESCKDDQQYLVRNCNTYKSWSASQESCQKYYSSYNNYCGEFAKSLPFTPPHENDDRSPGSQNLKECTAYQQQFNRECTGYTPMSPGGIMASGDERAPCVACSKPVQDCEVMYQKFMNKCDEFKVSLPLKLGTSSGGGTGNPNQCTALYSKFVEECNAVSLKDEDRSDCKNLEVDYKAACATPATPTASEGVASGVNSGSGNSAGDSSNTSALETGNNGSMRITNQPDVSSACDAAMKSMLYHCNETSIFTKDCEAASAKKRQTCDGVHTPNHTSGNNQGSSGTSGPADQNDRSDYCKKTYTYLTQHCVSGEAAGSGTCSDTRHNYDEICFGSGGDTGRGGDTGNEGEDNVNQDSGGVGTTGGNGSSGDGSYGLTREGLQLIPQ